jgi:hypothetical protein
MTAAHALSHTVACGIPGIGKVPWGSHFSLLYTTRQSLVDGLVAYFQTGILNNERCFGSRRSGSPPQTPQRS